MEHPKENVLVIPATLARTLAPKLFNLAPFNVERTILENCSFLDRESAEQNFEFKQVIPYVLVRHADFWLMSRRTKAQQETRLHDKCSLGQGGHINDLDFVSNDPILTGLLRELREEFVLDAEYGCSPVGLVNDDSNEVGKVHFGIVFEMRVKSLKLEVGEKSKHQAQWVPTSGLRLHYDAMENWSKIVTDHFILGAYL